MGIKMVSLKSEKKNYSLKAHSLQVAGGVDVEWIRKGTYSSS